MLTRRLPGYLLRYRYEIVLRAYQNDGAVDNEASNIAGHGTFG